MSAKPFLDTNVLIYAFARPDPRMPVAVSLFEAGGTIGVQTLNEFISVSRRKLRRTWDEIEHQTQVIRAFLDPPLPLSIEDHDLGVSIAKRFGFNIFDGMIVASAIRAGCTTLYTEDLQHGQQIEGLTIRNPFTA